MISVSKRNFKKYIYVIIWIFILYILGYLLFKSASLYRNNYEKNSLTHELALKKEEVKNIKRQVKVVERKTKEIEASYIKKDELEEKVKGIFERFSLFNYNLEYLDSKKMCVDRHAIVVRLTADSEEGKKAGEGILSYIGKIKKSENSDTIYFVDYIAQKKKKAE